MVLVLRRALAALALLADFATLRPLAVRADDRAALLARTQRFTQLRSFRLVLDARAPSGPLPSRILTYEAPDRLRIEIPSELLVEIVVGRAVWLRRAHGSWQRATLAPGVDPFAAVHDGAFVARAIRHANVHAVGSATLGGARTDVFEIDARPRPGYSAKTERLWIGSANGYPYKIVQRNGSFASTASYSGFDRPQTISAPTPDRSSRAARR